MTRTLDEILLNLDDIATDRESLVFLHDVLRYTRPRVVIEAGTYKGHFAEIAAGFADRVFTADPIDHGHALPEECTYVNGDFEAMLPSLTEYADFAFIDSGPPFAEGFEAGVRIRHYEAAKHYVRKGGLIAVHDTNATDWTGALTIIQEAGIRFRGGRGLTLLQV